MGSPSHPRWCVRAPLLPVCTALASLALSGCGGSGAGPAVATVGNEPITRSSLDHWVAVSSIGGETRAGRRAVLGRLIASHWVLGEAREYDIHVTVAEARKQLGLLRYARTAGTALGLFAGEARLQRLLTGSRLTSADRLWLVTIQMLASRIRQRLVAQAERTLGHDRVAGFYRENRRSFVAPEQRDLQVFMTTNRVIAERGKREVESGTSFASVAKRLNIAPEAHDGLIMGLARGAGEPRFERHVFTARLGVLLGPVLQALYYVFRVTKIVPSRLRPLPEVERSIRRRLATRAASDVLLPALTRRWLSRTSFSPGYEAVGLRAASIRL
jgi:foldase protein PrsA